MARLNVNIDHVATVREARKTIEPSVLAAARTCEAAGAHGITVHIRGDRRHIQDHDIEELKSAVTTYLNVELAATEEMVEIATRIKPDAVSLVPENPGEVTTEGGLDVVGNFDNVAKAVNAMKNAGVHVSIFIDPDTAQIDAAQRAGAQQIELCTAEYAELTLADRASTAEGRAKADAEIERIRSAAAHAKSIGLVVAAGHGLTTANVADLAAIPDIEEYNIGHHIISRAIFIWLEAGVKEMLVAIASADAR
ncbi:MAG TPA: pyridoxine 5'-phosphate synthase [Pyrinomonadaceae bacterium]|nr:pyridoxine 5'-phosphate synthase [Pyrinomonadaceae bacterium]